ncbi:MAG: hypothetical protein II706_08120 [Bacteroidaceae bacterium]|nr:hypothetical protein [Bacteroidaceae bacterium]
MGKLWKNDEVEALWRKYNPLGLRFPNGRPYEFNTRTEVYLTVMNRVHALFPRGYIETVLLVSTLYPHLSFKEAREHATWMEPMGVAPCVMVDYQHKEASLYFDSFLRALHKICESDFDNNSYKEAWNLFQNRLELETLKQQQKNEQENERGKE